MQVPIESSKQMNHKIRVILEINKIWNPFFLTPRKFTTKGYVYVMVDVDREDSLKADLLPSIQQ